MKNNSLSRFGIAAAAVAALCFATSAGAIEQFPPLRTGANTGVSPAPGTKSPGAPAAKLSDKDKAFMMNAAKGGMMEVEMGKQAAQNAQSADVKKFGNRMVTDHSKANAELMKLAKEEGVSLPGPKAAGKWKSDKDYMADMVKDHQLDLAEFQAEAKNGSDPDLKAWANKGAAMVSKHLALAQQTQSKLK